MKAKIAIIIVAVAVVFGVAGFLWVRVLNQGEYWVTTQQRITQRIRKDGNIGFLDMGTME